MDLFNLPFFRSYEAQLGWLISRVKNVETSEANAKASEEAAKASEEAAKVSEEAAADSEQAAANSASASANSAESISGVVAQVQANTASIDGLIAHAGDGTVPSELTDIRVGWDGKTWTTAGAAVRGQVSNLHKDISTITGVEVLHPTWAANTCHITNVNPGVQVNLTGTTVQYAESTIIECSPGESYIINGTGLDAYRAWAFLDGLDVMIDHSTSGLECDNLELTAPANAAKLVLNRWANPASYFPIYKGSKLPWHFKGTCTDFEAVNESGLYAVTPATSGVPNLFGGYGFLDVKVNGVYKTATLYRDLGGVAVYGNNKWNLPFTERKITMIGDSHTEHNNTAVFNLATYLEAEGATVQNLGIGGTGFAKNNPYINRIDSINSDCDMIYVSASFNDMSAGINIGSPTDTGTGTVSGYINDFFDALLEAFPGKMIVCYSTLPWDIYRTGNERSDTYIDNLETICKNKGVAFCRTPYDNTSVRPWQAGNAAEYYYDGSHPNAQGQAVWYKHLKPFLLENNASFPW